MSVAGPILFTLLIGIGINAVVKSIRRKFVCALTLIFIAPWFVSALCAITISYVNEDAPGFIIAVGILSIATALVGVGALLQAIAATIWRGLFDAETPKSS